MIAFCAWFSSRDESSGIGEPSVAAAQSPPSGCCQTASLWEEEKYPLPVNTVPLPFGRLPLQRHEGQREREREREDRAVIDVAIAWRLCVRPKHREETVQGPISGALLRKRAASLTVTCIRAVLRYVEDHTVHLVPEGGMALPPNVHAAEASGGRVERDVLPLQLPQRAKPAHPAPGALRARGELQHGARRRKRVDHAQDGEAE